MLSIDSNQEVLAIKIHILSEKKAVKAFLSKLNEILQSTDFDVGQDLIIIKSDKEEIEYSTNYTLVDLEYDTSDIVERLKELTIADYSETLVDKDNDDPPLLFVFGKDINDRLVYIKLKIKDGNTKKVLCLSFHYAMYPMEFPYRQA
ncbi:MAG: hypothetical protein E7305_01900 [Butyrivibrio sp.]|nr:hypothetical protein [Butyrivibrio sp.]